MADWPELLEQALDHFVAGRLDQAGAVLDRVTARDPGNAEAMYLRGVMAFQQADSKAALGFLDNAVAGDPSVGRFHNTRAVLLSIVGRLEDARDAYGAAIPLEPDNANNWTGLGSVLDRLGDTEAAVDACRRATEIDPQSSQAHGTLAPLLLALGRHGEALESAKAAVALDDEDADLHCILGAIHAVREEDELAEASARRSLALDPGQADSIRTLAHVLRRTGRDDEAEMYERRLETLSTSPR